jgi:predicted CxxxxCH...CXXCH cytochrome family protein
MERAAHGSMAYRALRFSTACLLLLTTACVGIIDAAPDDRDATTSAPVDARPAPGRDGGGGVLDDASPSPPTPDAQIVSATCSRCHGDDTSAAPPLSLDGETATTAPGVGAHRAHLGTSSWHAEMRCDDCHRVPSVAGWDPAFPQHLNGTVELTFSARAGAAQYDAATRTCSGVACHGAALGGDRAGATSLRTPVWTTVDGAQTACGAGCHTLPPGGGHTDSGACAGCHAQVIATISGTSVTWSHPERHIDGVVDATGGASCTACHGTEPGQPSPPRGVGGETSTATLAVGRHVAHLTAAATHAAIACGSCHVVPTDFDAHTQGYIASSSLADAGHHGDVTFGGAAAGMTWNVAATQGAPPTARGTCTGGCHSDGRGGRPRVVPYWAGGSWTSGACDSCHASRPASGRHGGDHDSFTCATCHPAATAATHVDGHRDVLGTAAGATLTMTPPGGACGTRYTCTGSCHGENHSSWCW